MKLTASDEPGIEEIVSNINFEHRDNGHDSTTYSNLSLHLGPIPTSTSNALERSLTEYVLTAANEFKNSSKKIIRASDRFVSNATDKYNNGIEKIENGIRKIVHWTGNKVGQEERFDKRYAKIEKYIGETEDVKKTMAFAFTGSFIFNGTVTAGTSLFINDLDTLQQISFYSEVFSYSLIGGMQYFASKKKEGLSNFDGIAELGLFATIGTVTSFAVYKPLRETVSSFFMDVGWVTSTSSMVSQAISFVPYTYAALIGVEGIKYVWNGFREQTGLFMDDELSGTQELKLLYNSFKSMVGQKNKKSSE